MREEIGRQQSPFTLRVRHGITGACVQTGSEAGRAPGIKTLRQQRRDHAGKHVAHASGRHAGIAPRAHRDAAIGRGDQRAGALKHHHRGVATCKFADGSKTVGLDCRNVAAGETRGLARMRRQHHGAATEVARLRSQEIQAVGIEHQRCRTTHRRIEQCAPPRITPKARTAQNHVGVAEAVGQTFTLADRMHHQFRARRQQRRDMLGTRANTDPPRTTAQRGLSGQPYGTAETVIAAKHQHVAEVALVGIAATTRWAFLAQQDGVGRNVDIRRVGQVERRKHAFAANLRALASEQAALPGHETDRCLRACTRAEATPAVGVETTRHIQRKDRRAVATELCCELCRDTFERTVEAAAEQRVHVHVRIRQFSRRCGRHDVAAGIEEGHARLRSVTTRDWRQRREPNLESTRARQRTEQETVATVVAGTTGNRDPSRLRPAPLQFVQRGARRAVHQLAAGDARADCMHIDITHLRGGVEVGGDHAQIIEATQSYNNAMDVEAIDYRALAADIKHWALELGFNHAGISDVDLAEDTAHLDRWLADGLHGKLDYMKTRRDLRAHPDQLQPGAIRAISVRMNYTAGGLDDIWRKLADGDRACISRFALGRDYHKVMRRRLQKLADRITQHVDPWGYRAFCDSAPVLEKALARKAGLGWVGKHTLLLARDAGSWFFIGEILTDLPLPVDMPVGDYCGTCTRCIDVCPTQAILAPYRLDARRCISYLTIEQKGSIPEELRRPMGNRIFGCDDCQAICPWNKFAKLSEEPDFAPRHALDEARLVDLFAWSEEEYLQRTQGMALRRAGYEGWLRNIAVALGNAPPTERTRQALASRLEHPSALVREHVVWALAEQHRKTAGKVNPDTP